MKLSTVMGIYASIFLIGYFTGRIEITLVGMAIGTIVGMVAALMEDAISELIKNTKNKGEK